MKDIFDNKILCSNCDKEMEKKKFAKGGFVFRAVVCPKCGEKVLHPEDKQEYKKYQDLKNKEFRVKMRLVGNSYAVSIPKEIVSFMEEQERVLDHMVKLCFEDMGKLSLNFGDENA
jgi:predicted amidophosphoribosyltransferase